MARPFWREKVVQPLPGDDGKHYLVRCPA